MSAGVTSQAEASPSPENTSGRSSMVRPVADPGEGGQPFLELHQLAAAVAAPPKVHAHRQVLLRFQRAEQVLGQLVPDLLTAHGPPPGPGASGSARCGSASSPCRWGSLPA